MSLIDVLDNLFLGSLLVIYQGAFTTLLAAVDSVGGTLIGFSLVLNLVLMPVYYQMERAAKAGNERRGAMDLEVARMKKHYTGRERYYYIRTVHRQFGYSPLSTVLSAGDLYLQVLVFSTVYRYLASNPALAGAAFGPITDLSAPDAMFHGINLLPVLMTVLNVASTAFYATEKTKLRSGIAIALLFLVLLYQSPAGVVLYWTCNNAFSLVRNAIQRKLIPALPTRTMQWFSRLASQE